MAKNMASRFDGWSNATDSPYQLLAGVGVLVNFGEVVLGGEIW